MTRRPAVMSLTIASLSVLLGSGCSDPSAPTRGGRFEAEMQGAIELVLRGKAGFAQNDTVDLVSFTISLSQTIRDTTFYISMLYPSGRPPQGVYSVLGGTGEYPDFYLGLTICNDPGRKCSSYMPQDGLINLTSSSATKISGVFNAVMRHSDPAILQQIFIDGTFDAVCDPTLLRPINGFCR